MLEISRAIEKLSDCCDRGMTTFDQDFKEAVRMGKKALKLLAYDTAHRLSDQQLELLLQAERVEKVDWRWQKSKNKEKEDNQE